VKIFVWGTGCPVSGLVGRYLAPEDVTAFVDNDASKAEFMGRPVISPAELAGRGADLIVVANRHGAEIAEQCEKLGIDPAKLFYMYDNYYLADRNADYAAAERALGRELTEKVRRSGRIIRSMDGEDVPGGDYVRLKTLSLAAAEIYAGGVPGAAAELGVYRGEFAAEINRLFPDRKLYLFDTFGGFGAAEAAAETEKKQLRPGLPPRPREHRRAKSARPAGEAGERRGHGRALPGVAGRTGGAVRLRFAGRGFRGVHQQGA
jgi:O-methyltransferase